MGNTVQVSGTLVAGPSSTSENQFPSGVTNIPFGLNTPNKPYNVDTGSGLATVSSPGAYVALGGVGASGPVTQGHTLYLRSAVPLLVRLTVAVPSSPDLVIADIPLSGLLVLEFPSDRYLKLVEVKGAGTVEYYAAGTQ